MSREMKSPKQGQDFIWFAEYLDGTSLVEFEQDCKENSFYDIDKSKLLRFGLMGNGMSLYYEADGVFKLAGQSIEIVYRDKATDKGYYLTGRQQMYNDVISYKDAEAFASFTGQGMVGMGDMKSNITQYNFGYKTSFAEDATKFNFQAICKIPYGQPVHMNFRLNADKNIDGILTIIKRGVVVAEIEAPLQAGVSGELNWMVSL
jgi:hypothetical protein